MVAANTPEKLPAVVGMPVTNPVAAERVRPGGNDPDWMLKAGAGSPLAVNVAEKDAPVRRVALRAALVKALVPAGLLTV